MSKLCSSAIFPESGAHAHTYLNNPMLKNQVNNASLMITYKLALLGLEADYAGGSGFVLEIELS